MLGGKQQLHYVQMFQQTIDSQGFIDFFMAVFP
jgi:hypothetical protein